MTDSFPRLRVIFMGTPDFAVPALRRICDSPACEVIAVYSKAPSPAGRGQIVRKTPVHDEAEARGIRVFTPKSFKKDPQVCADFAALRADVAVVAAYGLILPKAVLDAPRLGCINIHASLLPRWRGAAPIQRAIEAGDTQSGITIMQMDEGLDTGAMLLKGVVSITTTTTAQGLHDDLSAMGGDLIVTVLDKLRAGQAMACEIQDDALSCYAPMLRKEEGFISWHADALSIDRKIRAFTPWPGCWSLDESGKRLKIMAGTILNAEILSGAAGTILNADGDIACGRGIYRLGLVQPENSKVMDFKAVLNGHKLKVGTCLNAGN